MTYYLLVDDALSCLYMGGHDDCLAQALITAGLTL